MGLDRAMGAVITKQHKEQISNSLIGVEVDYYFMASRFANSKNIISMNIWTVIVDAEGFVYGIKTHHLGDYNGWEQLIRDRISEHLHSIGVDNLIVKRMVRDLEIKKEGHIIPSDTRCGGDRIGINGADEIHIRKNKFSYIR